MNSPIVSGGFLMEKWIYSARTLATRNERMAKAITKLSPRLKCFEQPKE